MTRARAAIAKALVVGESAAMRSVIDRIEELADSDIPVLIDGERGTGRELIARVVHFAGPRRNGHFLSVKAGGAPRPIFGDQFDGKPGGAFRLARGGTLLVKDVGALPRGSQRALNRVLRTRGRKHVTDTTSKVIDVRVMASSDHDLESAVAADVFNRDLYTRLEATRIEVPPLRKREADIPVLADYFIRQYGKEIGRRKKLTPRAQDRLVKYPWPGNVAELKDIARRLVIRAPRGRIQAGDVEQVLPSLGERVPLEDMAFEDMVRAKLSAFLRRVEGYSITGLHEDVVARVERPMFQLVMEHTGGNQVRAAEILGVNRNTLRRKLSEYGIHARTLRARAKRERRGSEAKPASRSRRG